MGPRSAIKVEEENRPAAYRVLADSPLADRGGPRRRLEALIMSIPQNLSLLALRAVFDGACKSVGVDAGADAAVNFLTSRFTDHSQRLGTALQKANASAWRALELALAGDSWWDRVKGALARREDQAFREQVSAFLQTTPLANLPSHGPEFRQQALRDLRAAHKGGALSGALSPEVLAREAGPFAHFGDPASLLDAEWRAVDAILLALRQAGHTALAHFLGLRPQGDLPMLVVAVRYFFRREVETDAQLFHALAFSQLERLNQSQEVGYAALSAALVQHASRLEELLDDVRVVVAETHADVQGLKATLDQHGQHLQAVGQAVLRALAQSAQPAAPVPAGEPRRPEQNIRLAMLNTLLTTPHRQLDQVWPVHQELVARDPLFYARLTAWYFDKGEVRDHKEMFVVTLSLSTFEGHRDVGLALLRRLPPYQVARVVDFIHGRKETRRRTILDDKGPRRGPGRHAKPKKPTKGRVVREVIGDFGLFRSVPRCVKTEVARYLREREASPEWFDSTALIARKALKRLYSVLHVKPGERAQKVLFDEQPPADSRVGALKRLARIADPKEQAKAIVAARIPFRIAVSVLGEMTPAILESLIELMTPQEVINNLGLLQRHGALTNPDLKAMVELKLEEAKSDTRVSSLKAEAAMQAVPVGNDLKKKLEEVVDVQIKAQGRIRRPTGLLIDKSGSMELAIDLGKRIAAMLSTVCEKELYVYAFDTMAYPIEPKGNDWGAWKKAFAGINAGGETSAGVALEYLRRRKQFVEQIIVVTDEEEYSPPYFVESLLKYRQALSADPAVTFVKVPDSSTRLEEQCKRAGIAATTFDFNGDYYSLPNLVALLEPPSELDLLMEIMDYPLPERRTG